MEYTVIIAKILILFVALEHVMIVWVEMFSWEKIGKKMFKSFPENLFKPTRVMAANQGLYNGFLAAGLLWSLTIENSEWQRNVSLYFLGCVVIAGIYGALSVSKRIFYTQALPAIISFITAYFCL